MSDTSDDELSPRETVVNFVKAVLRRETRAAALKGVGAWMGGFAGLCGAIVGVVAVAQIRGIGLLAAWACYGAWWLTWPVLAALAPVAFVLFLAAAGGAVELSYWVVLIPLYVIPSLIVGEDRSDRWLAHAGKFPLFAIAALVLWAAWTGGTDSVVTHTTHASDGGSPFVWVGALWHWLRTNPWIALVGTFLYKPISKLADKWTSKAAEALTEDQPKRKRQLYGPDNRVVREFTIDN